MANISKLTSDQVSEMLRLYEEGATKSSLAKRYNVSLPTISNKIKAATEPKVEASAIETVVEAEVNEVLEAVRKKKEPPKRRIVGVNI